CHQHNTYPFTF
nr:immunoglobulin light chain junction region [Macaca mulatta]MOW44566.1 immunoglobulin light chain junction region [Macaca mulatta]